MAKRYLAGRLRKMRDIRPLVFSFADSEALLQFTAACRRLPGPPPAALYRMAGGYRLIFWEDRPIPPALFACLTETAAMKGGLPAAAAVVCTGTPLSDNVFEQLHMA